ncbi:MAG: patatin-like phospholipase family protein [Promicromonosporaceae bacterium]|nr:patatin-like phospholipase family protein [Promicromonosporaceae bacterium]
MDLARLVHRAPPEPEPGRNIFVLSGGASRGAAQVGMLRVLLKHGVVPDLFVAGSVGSLNAVYLAQDVSLDQVDRLERIYQRLGNLDLIGPPHAMVLNVLRHQPSLASGRRIREFIASCAPVERIEDLTVPVRIATFDVDDGRFTWHDGGNLVDVVAASCALPGIYPPVEIDGHLHVDYGVRYNLPTDAAVDLVRPGDTVWSLEVNRVPVPRAMRSPWDAMMIVAGSSISHNSLRDFPAGVAVHRIVLDRTFDTGFAFNFAHTAQLVQMGEQAAQAVIDGAGVAVATAGERFIEVVAAPTARFSEASLSAGDVLAYGGVVSRAESRVGRVERLPAVLVARAALALRISLERLVHAARRGVAREPATERVA